MKTTLITFLFLFNLISIHSHCAIAQKHKVVDLGEYILDTLGVSIAEKSDPNAAKKKAEHQLICYWNKPDIIFEYAGKSATPAELLKFVNDKKKLKKIEAVLGYNFLLIAVDSKSLFKVKVNSGEVSYEILSNTRENESMFFSNDIHYLKKKL